MHEPLQNIFREIPVSLAEELTEIILQKWGLRIERIISHGHCSPADFWYDQNEHEWVIVLQGEAELLLEGYAEPQRLRPGDFIHLPAHCRHRVVWTTPNQPTLWLAVFYRD